jgi:hypothetical protein
MVFAFEGIDSEFNARITRLEDGQTIVSPYLFQMTLAREPCVEAGDLGNTSNETLMGARRDRRFGSLSRGSSELL